MVKDSGQAGVQIEVTCEMIDAAIPALDKYVSDGGTDFGDYRVLFSEAFVKMLQASPYQIASYKVGH